MEVLKIGNKIIPWLFLINSSCFDSEIYGKSQMKTSYETEDVLGAPKEGRRPHNNAQMKMVDIKLSVV